MATMLEKQLVAATKEVSRLTRSVERARAKFDKAKGAAAAVGMAIDFETWVEIRDTATQQQRAAHFDYFSAEEDLKDSCRRLANASNRLTQLEAAVSQQESQKAGQLEIIRSYDVPAINEFLDEWERQVITYYTNKGELNDQKVKDIAHDKEIKKLSLLYRISQKVGKAVDAKGLYVAHDGNLNGLVVGEYGMARVTTILAGGWNVQCLHYRVLVD